MKQIFGYSLIILISFFYGCATPALNTQTYSEQIQSIFGKDESEFRLLSYCYFKSLPEATTARVSQSISMVGLTDEELMIVKGNLKTAQKADVIRIPIADIDTVSMPRELHITHNGLLTAIVLFRWGDLKTDPIKTLELKEMLAYENVPEIDADKESSLYGPIRVIGVSDPGITNSKDIKGWASGR